MTIQLYANNAKTTLAAPITATQTTITVAPGTGSLFPSPTTGQQFKVTLVSAASSSTYEICNCTARSGDTLTVVRAQEGTTGTPFLLSDIVGNYDTAAVMANLVQSAQLQSAYYTYAYAAGTANALTATLPSTLTALTDGMSVTIVSAYANTGAATFNLTLGSTVTGALPIVVGNNTALTAGYIPGAGYPLSLTYSVAYNAWVLDNPIISLAAYALLNSPAFTGVPTAPTYGIPAPSFPAVPSQLATLDYVYNSLLNYALINSPGFTGTPTAPTPSAGTNNTQIATTAFVNSVAKGLGLGGESWHNVLTSRALDTTYTNTNTYPIMVNTCVYTNGAFVAFFVDGQPVGECYEANFNSYTNATVGSSISAIVPPGKTYGFGIIGGGGTASLAIWAELY